MFDRTAAPVAAEYPRGGVLVALMAQGMPTSPRGTEFEQEVAP